MRKVKNDLSGLTLMEMLVVLVLTSLIATLLLQGTTFLYGSHERVNYHLKLMQKDILPDSWFRASVAKLVASLDEDAGFSGNANGFRGYSYASVMEQEGKLVRVEWRLTETTQGVELWLAQSGHENLLTRQWADAQSAQFFYMNHSGQFSSVWPTTDQEKLLLPLAIRLEVVFDDDYTLAVLASVEVRKRGPLDFRDLF
jgi:general secretion pathway protein J